MTGQLPQALLQEGELAELRTSVMRLTAELDERKRLDATRTAELEEDRRLLATLTEARDLITDENVHIWTVHDSDENGKRRQAFGRIIYTEGKRLVFYAYKLPDRKNTKAQISFYVWGEKAGTAQPVKSLGTLRIDDAGARRWKLTFEDRDVLTQINSVFVTAESGPKGKKILSSRFETD